MGEGQKFSNYRDRVPPSIVSRLAPWRGPWPGVPPRCRPGVHGSAPPGCLWPMAHVLWRMGYGHRDPDLPLSEHCKTILLPGGNHGLGCHPGAHGSAPPDAPPSAVLWGRRKASSPSFSRTSPTLSADSFPSWGRVSFRLGDASSFCSTSLLRTLYRNCGTLNRNSCIMYRNGHAPPFCIKIAALRIELAALCIESAALCIEMVMFLPSA